MWLIFTLVFVLAQIAFLQFFKVAIKDSKNVGAFTVLVQVVASLSILVLCPFFGWAWPRGWLVWVLLLVSLGLYAVNDRLDATVRKNIDISVDAMVQQVYRIFFLVMGIAFLGRSFVWLKLLGCVIIIFANVFLLFDKGKFKINRYVLLKVLSALIFAAAFTLDTYNSPEFNLPFFVFVSFAVPACCLMLTRQATFRGLVTEVKRKQWPIIVACGVCNGLSAFAILRAYQFYQHFVEVAAVSASYVILNVLLATVFLRERGNLVQKFIAGAVIVGSIVMIALV
ncbi:MAG: EamA family transporter [Christensenellaceae bacterium]|jgi:drug/metabolite transporter (DMT)-like permease|nr:EamA family transporter [Christensenellaceae bacterium]